MLNSLNKAFGALSAGDSEVTKMAKGMASHTVNADRVILGTTMQIKRVQFHVFWVKDHENTRL